jgi:regulator of replication initiation timing
VQELIVQLQHCQKEKLLQESRAQRQQEEQVGEVDKRLKKLQEENTRLQLQTNELNVKLQLISSEALAAN